VRANFFSLTVTTTLSLMSFAATATPVNATNLITNGDFEFTSMPGVASEFGSRYPSQQVTGWQTDGYNFLFTPGSADTTGAAGESGTVSLWGPNNGASNGLPAASPTGGNYLALSGDRSIYALSSQPVKGLVPGVAATLTFYWAGAQQRGYEGTTSEQLLVTLGDESYVTEVLNNDEHGFTGWRQETFTFTPNTTMAVLSFLAVGTPDDVSQFALLDGLSLTTAPEPAAVGFVLVGLGMIGVGARRRSASRQPNSL
jgi:hypothetical protein